MSGDEVRRLIDLAIEISHEAKELSALLVMPAEEEANGDLHLLDIGQYTSCVHGAAACVAHKLLQIECAIETLTRREDAKGRDPNVVLTLVSRSVS